jgi:hypothetical protein
MNQIVKGIKDHNNPDRDTRYEACEELRIANRLPESAVAALAIATHDPDPLVSEAARQAVAIHRPPSLIGEPITDSHVGRLHTMSL